MIHLVLSVLLGVNFVVDTSEAPMLESKKAVVKDPEVVYVTDFDEDSAKKFEDDVQKALETGQPILPIVINSYGGSIYALTSMLDALKSVKIPVATICSGKCMSCGSVLLAAGTDGYRYAGPNATILIHDASTMVQGKVEDIINETNELIRLNNLIFTFMARQAGKSDDYFLKMLDAKGHIDLFLTPEQTQEYGIINHVKNPMLKVRVKTEMVLE